VKVAAGAPKRRSLCQYLCSRGNGQGSAWTGWWIVYGPGAGWRSFFATRTTRTARSPGCRQLHPSQLNIAADSTVVDPLQHSAGLDHTFFRQRTAGRQRKQHRMSLNGIQYS
jgi:hypothetical protein